jgi:hypothetical protein
MIYRRTIVSLIDNGQIKLHKISHMYILKNYKNDSEYTISIDSQTIIDPEMYHIHRITKATEDRWGIYFMLYTRDYQQTDSQVLIYYIKKDNTQKSARN